MDDIMDFSTAFKTGLSKLGFDREVGECLFFTKHIDNYAAIHNLWFHLEKAKIFQADAIFCRKIIGEKFVPQVYLYDYTTKEISDESTLIEVHKKVWTSAEVPIVCVFTKTEIRILDTTSPIDRENCIPAYLDKIALTSKAHRVFNEQFANSVKTGVYWTNESIQKKLSFRNSSYSILIEYLNAIINDAVKDASIEKKRLIQKLIVQSILIKYLEEKEDQYGNKVFPPGFFSSYSSATCFCDILRNGRLFDFLEDLNKNHFNGKVFEWGPEEKRILKESKFPYLASALSGDSNVDGQLSIWRLYSFNFIPVELISRLYEEFIEDREKSDDGAAYTPSHLANLLVDEIMPVDEAKDPANFKIIDPACGSGIFLVIAFRRLIQWWRAKNQFNNPSLTELKSIVRNSIFGVDKNETATQLAAFSLCIALCEELTPKQIWNELRFDDLTKKNISHADFFDWLENNKDEKGSFDIVIGNPPFVRGGVTSDLGKWNINETTSIGIPQKQIALKFLSESINLLKPKAQLCLIIKASGLLYNSTSMEYKKGLFENFNVNQILDFTPLARNKSLWDCGTDVAAAAIFLTNEFPDAEKNILHAVFRRTKAVKERIAFEIDEYDLHYISQNEAAHHPYIFKINLMGGGRINPLVKKCSDNNNIESYLCNNNCGCGEGFIKGKGGKLSKEFIYIYPYLPTEAFDEYGIHLPELPLINRNDKFIKIPDKELFECPNIIIKENIGEKEIPVFFNMVQNFSFKDKLIGIYSKNKDTAVLRTIYNSFKENIDLYRFFTFVTSSQLLINKNTAILKEDIMRLPLFSHPFTSTEIDSRVILDVINYIQDFHRKGENSTILQPVVDNSILKNYGIEFSRVLNQWYADNNKMFKLSDIVRFTDDKFIGTVFTYDDFEAKEPDVIKSDYSEEISGLSHFRVSEHFSSTRIIRYYSKNKLLFVKPNQMRYWLSTIAYRDADKTFADISALG